MLQKQIRSEQCNNSFILRFQISLNEEYLFFDWTFWVYCEFNFVTFMLMIQISCVGIILQLILIKLFQFITQILIISHHLNSLPLETIRIITSKPINRIYSGFSYIINPESFIQIQSPIHIYIFTILRLNEIISVIGEINIQFDFIISRSVKTLNELSFKLIILKFVI